MAFPEPALTPEYFTFVLLWALPITTQVILMFFEGIRTIPGEIRMMMRIHRRGRPNIVEIIFFVIKYIAILATVMSVLQEWTPWLTAKSCLAASWILQLGLSLCTVLVSTSLAWRCYVIFQRNRRVGLILLGGLIVHLAMSLFAAIGQAKYDIKQENYCGWSDAMLHKNHSHKWYQIHASWFMLYSTAFDTVMVIAASWRLLKFVRGPTGLQRIGRLLFINNLHYLAIVSTINLIQFFVLCFRFSSIPPLMWLTETLQIIVCLQMLISEQDEAHGYSNRAGQQTAYRGGGGGGGIGGGGYSGGKTPGSSFVPVKSGTSSKPQQSTFSSLDQAEIRQPLEGIRFDALHSESIVDRDTTMSQIQAGVTKEITDLQHPAPHPWAYQQDSSISHGPSTPHSGCAHNSNGRTQVYGYEVSSTLPATSTAFTPRLFYGTEPSSFHTSPPASLGDGGGSSSSPRPPKSGGGLSVKAIRAGLDYQQSHRQMPISGATAANCDDAYAMKPVSVHSAQGSEPAGNSGGRKRAMSSHSNASVCTCARSGVGQQVSYGTALTCEMTNPREHATRRDTTLSTATGASAAVGGASPQVDTTISFDAPKLGEEEGYPSHRLLSFPHVGGSEAPHDHGNVGVTAGDKQIRHVHSHVEQMTNGAVNPDAPFADYNTSVRYRF
ncbi:hypothetical protein BDZ90DRAFT_40090 [Jaminaea rosea]|uniref:Uncharacterized protein n=1 Tax=Jaminaea rosea TaxID=1569628 RepID=A0A316UP03_9BASI|nr:hypothetical protein BDZ90DRAFT_40090 [Jaminaea rosea]PWN26498.1 hypothetical protein BDZ90DRAFT_40090 [Jaminaea rosea]